MAEKIKQATVTVQSNLVAWEDAAINVFVQVEFEVLEGYLNTAAHYALSNVDWSSRHREASLPHWEGGSGGLELEVAFVKVITENRKDGYGGLREKGGNRSVQILGDRGGR